MEQYCAVPFCCLSLQLLGMQLSSQAGGLSILHGQRHPQRCLFLLDFRCTLTGRLLPNSVQHSQRTAILQGASRRSNSCHCDCWHFLLELLAFARAFFYQLLSAVNLRAVCIVASLVSTLEDVVHTSVQSHLCCRVLWEGARAKTLLPGVTMNDQCDH